MFIQYSPSRVFLGKSAIEQLPALAAAEGTRGIMVVDPMLAKTDIISTIKQSLELRDAKIIVYDEAPGKVNSIAVDTLVSLCLASKAEYVIGIGGVETLAIAKAAASFTGCEGLFSDRMSDLPGNSRPLPYIEIPTAIRNPQMLTPFSWIADKKTRIPQYISAAENYPRAVLLDPVFCQSLSETFYYSSLMDLFLLSVEGYVSSLTNFYCDSLFLKTTSFVLSLQQKEQHDYRNEESELTALEAGLLYACAANTVLPGIGETLSRAVNSRYRVPKSVVSSILLPHVLEYLAEKQPGRIARMASLLEIPVDNLPDSEAAQRVVENVRFHIGLEGVPSRLSEFNVSLKEFKNLTSIVAAQLHLKQQNIDAVAIGEIIEKAF
ncbi:MAG: iron-containing alcohol dehydrogenase [Spirochaetales bacterium]|nr:iron-containing alcohol dehydrogenase [Spirochaetales bacterium]